MTSARLSAFLVEDEPLCRADFRQTLRMFPEVHLLGEADNLTRAEQFLRKTSVDLLFLDLSVGRENGLDLLDRISPQPLVIALTAHPQHAVRGFSLNLVDYILKPVEEDRFRQALGRARLRKESSWLRQENPAILAELGQEKAKLEVTEILRIESTGNYQMIWTHRGKAIRRGTFRELRKKLPSSLFLETGRGRMVARNLVRGWSRNSDGYLVLNLTHGGDIQVARSYGGKILKTIKNSLET
jgi:two-component system, LytTR family, response regulator